MKDYIDQIYNENLGRLIYSPIKKFLDKIITNKKVNKFFTIFIKVVYSIIILTILSLYLYISLN